MYDTVPTVLWPPLQSQAAMTLGAAVTFDAMDSTAIAREARLWRHSPTSAVAAACRCAERLVDAVESELIDPESGLARRVLATVPRILRPPD